MPNILKPDATQPFEWEGGNDPTSCHTCPSHLAVEHDLNLQDHDLKESGATPVNAHLETTIGPDGQKRRRLVLSKI